MKNTKRSLLTSLASLLLCFVMLIGTTFAWFTDEATSANNIIKAGNLDINMYWNTDNGTNWKNAEGTFAEPIFDYDKWEPGHTEVRYIKVTNEGDLAFKYQMYINPTGIVGKLAEVIDVSYDVVTGNPDFEAPISKVSMGSLEKVGTLNDLISENIEIPGGVLLPNGETEPGYYTGEIVVCVAFHFQESAGNEYQGHSIGDGFGINLHATQFSYESDSFGTDYDKDAEWPARPVNAAGSSSIDSNNLLHGALTSKVTINANGGVSATIPAEVKVANGATNLNLTVQNADADANLTQVDGANAVGFNVHIDGIDPNNTTPMIVNLGPILKAGIGETELKLYHTENGNPELMTRVNSAADFALHNQYTYDDATGEVSIYVASFSVFSAVKTTTSKLTPETEADTSWYDESKDSFTLNDAADFLGFRNLVDAGTTFAGKTVTLGVDIDLNNINFDPIGFGYTYNKESNTAFMGTFDGANHTIYNLYQNGWDLDPDNTNYSTYTYSTAGGGLFASIENATIKNLAVSGADIKFECVDIGIVVGYAQGNCHFENIVVTNSKIANYNRATGAVVGEVCYGSYGTDVKAGYSHTFKNIVVDSSVVVSSLWGSFDTLIGGVIGGKWGNATVKMENVITAAELDVYSDVTAAYQWYAYRRCGMLIGHTEQNSPKSALNADAPFLTCENVNVFYGDWVNYTYYEFENQDSGTGQRYPWVRAEASPVGNNGAFSNPRYGVPTHGGVKVTELTKDELDIVKTDYTPITFNQLYGGGQGVYGKADHVDGVYIKYNASFNAENSVKTIYFQNSKDWTNLKLKYQYGNGTDKWTTVVDGFSLGDAVDTVPNHHIYKVIIPADAYSFTIFGDGEGNTTDEIFVDSLVAGDLYTMDSKNEIQHCDYNGQYKTVQFVDEWTWTANSFKVYYWYSNGTSNWTTVDWEDRTVMTSIGSKTYEYKIPAYAAGYIVSGEYEGHTLQTIDQTISNLDTVTYHPIDCVIIDSQKHDGMMTIFYQNDWWYDNVYLYDWDIATDKETTSWPGNKMTKVGYNGTYDIYAITIKEGHGFKINDGNTSDIRETDNITSGAYDGKMYTGGKSDDKIYLNVNIWDKNSARFAAYFFGNGEKWVNMTYNKQGGVYECAKQTGYTNVVFCRMNKNASANNWNNKWNQTGDLTVPTNSKNVFTVTTWDGQTTGWSQKP